MVLPIEKERLSVFVSKANDVVNKVYEYREKETVLRQQAAEQRALAKKERDRYQRYHILIPILMLLPLFWFNMILSGIFGFDFIFANKYTITLTFAIECGIISLLTFVRPCGDKKFIEEAEQFDISADNVQREMELYIANHANDVAVIHPKYRYPLASNFIVELFELDRVSSMPEAYDKVEEQLHRWNMEEIMGKMVEKQMEMMILLQDIATYISVL